MIPDWILNTFFLIYFSGMSWIAERMNQMPRIDRDRMEEEALEELLTLDAQAIEDDPWEDSDSDGMYENLPDAMEVHEASMNGYL